MKMLGYSPTAVDDHFAWTVCLNKYDMPTNKIITMQVPKIKSIRNPF